MRYVIKNSQGLFYTEMRCVESREVKLRDQVVGFEDIYHPVFESFRPEQASQLNTERDALDLMANPRFGGPTSFANCTVFAYSTDAKE